MRADLVITGGTVVDGSGRPGQAAAVAVTADRIVYVGPEPPLATRRLDALGMVVSPGFVDIHGHSDFTLLIDPRAASKVTQGVTTELVGNCGGWAIPLLNAAREVAEAGCRRYGAEDILTWTTAAEYRAELERARPALNVAFLVGHGTLRAAVMSFDDRAPGSDELERMGELLREALEAGAFGLSTGLYYAPGSYADADEVTALCRMVAARGGIHASHLRDEDSYSVGLLAALDEVLAIGRAAGVRTQVSHLKALGPGVWGQAPELLRRLECARRCGLDVACDQYPYVATGSSITGALIPRWAQEGGREALLARLSDPERRWELLVAVRANLARRGGAERLLIAGYPPRPEFEGALLSAVAGALGLEAAEAALELLSAADASLCTFVLAESDVDAIMPAAGVAVASDGYALAVDGPLAVGAPHPRSFGTFPRVLGRYVRERGLLRLEQAIHRMTGLPAGRLRLHDRGLLRPGFFADVVVFDPEQISDRSEFGRPFRYAQGIRWVLVNGEPVVAEGELTGVRAGRVLSRPN